MIVNPYLKKKKKSVGPPPSASGGGDRLSSSKRISGNNDKRFDRNNSSSRQPINPSNTNISHSHPSRVTPNAKKPSIASNKHQVLPPKTIEKGQKVPCNRAGIHNSKSRPANHKLYSTARISKTKLSVKQRLKQEIAALKKQKHLKKLQKEAEERMRLRMIEKKLEDDRRAAFLAAKEEERRQKKAERERLIAIREEEKIRRQQERERKQREKEEEREHKRQEKIRKEIEKSMHQMINYIEIEEKNQKATEKYQRDLKAWKKHNELWMEQQQRINMIQQAYQQAYQQQYSQRNAYVYNQHQIHSHQNHQRENMLRRNLPFISPSPESQIPFQSPPNQSIHQGTNSYSMLNGTNKADVGLATPCQKTPSPPPSPLDSSTALAIDSLMNSEIFSPTKLEFADMDKTDVITSVPLGMPSSSTLAVNTGNEGQTFSTDNKNLPASAVDESHMRVSEDFFPSDTNPALISSDKNDRSSQIQITSSEFNSAEPVPSTTTSSCANAVCGIQQLGTDLPLQPALVQPSPMVLAQNNVSTQQTRHMVPSSLNNQFSSHPSMQFPPMFSCDNVLTQGLTTTPHWYSMINSTFANANNYISSVPPPPPPPRPPILYKPKMSRRGDSVSRRAKAIKKSAPTLLCNPIESPSPFSNQMRHLVKILIIRDPRTEKSFGVNLKLHTESALVDPQWLEAQKQNKNTKKIDDCCKSDRNDIKEIVKGCLEQIVSSIEVAQNASNSKAATTQQESKTSGRELCTIISSNKNSASTTNKNTNKIDDSSKSDRNDIKEAVKRCLEEMVSSVEVAQNASNSKAATKQKRKRRRRVNFSVLQVSDANKQNTRRPDVDPTNKLQCGDIVISIQGHEIKGMTFQNACGMFSKLAETASDSLIQTQVIVARKTPVSTPVKVGNTVTENTSSTTSVTTPPSFKTPSMPIQTPAITETPSTTQQPLENSSMVFSQTEIAAMANCVFQTLHSSNRVLGLNTQDRDWEACSTIFQMGHLLKDTSLTPRASITLKTKWSHLTRFIDYNLVKKGKTFWANKFREEFGDEKIPFSSDVERHAMRHLPRPPRGCRCKQKDHEYLFDPKCTLYRDLQQRLSKEELTKLRQHRKKIKSNSNKDLNAVESAFRNRMLKLKIATENESTEARFVDRMEEIQVKELNKAVFPPNLTTIVLSALFELQREFHVLPEEDDFNVDVNFKNPDDDDDDDVPLDCLGKRKFENQKGETKKHHKNGMEGHPNFSIKYLIRLIEYVSKTWGHCYCEPSEDEYAWRWELFHAVHSDFDQWDSEATNPRVPGSFSFENVRFGLDGSRAMTDKVSTLPKTIREFEDSIISKSHCALDVSNEALDQFCLVIHFLSPAKTGLYDELIALLKMDIFKVSRSGIPIISPDWWTKIDTVVLDEMHVSWSTKVDPDSRYCVNEEFRDVLEEKWIRSDHGWSLSENPKDVVFDFAILDEWRETFEGRLEEKADLSEGIGLFGL